MRREILALYLVLVEKNLISNISFNVSVDFFMNLRKFPFIPSLLRVFFFFLIMNVWLIFVKYFPLNLLIRLYEQKFKPIDMMDYINWLQSVEPAL